jgi:hypothetical protein
LVDQAVFATIARPLAHKAPSRYVDHTL